jgi:hypothetical protein
MNAKHDEILTMHAVSASESEMSHEVVRETLR